MVKAARTAMIVTAVVSVGLALMAVHEEANVKTAFQQIAARVSFAGSSIIAIMAFGFAAILKVLDGIYERASPPAANPHVAIGRDPILKPLASSDTTPPPADPAPDRDETPSIFGWIAVAVILVVVGYRFLIG